MILRKTIPFKLTLFDGEGQGAEGGQSVSSDLDSTADAKANADANNEPNLDKEFDELIKTKYKSQYNNKFKAALDKRFEKSKATEQRLSEAEAVLTRVAEMTGNTDISDLQSLLGRLDSIDPNLEEEAMERGMPVDVLREIKAIERKNAQLEKAEQERIQQAQAQAQMEAWIEQANNCKALYGDLFDLDVELQNDEFKSLLEMDYPMQKAFEIVHIDDMVTGAMQYAARTTKTNIANDIRARGSRPSENGKHSNAPVKTSINYNNISSNDWNRITNLVVQGKVKNVQEAISFLNK